MNGKVNLKMTPREMKSLSYLFVHEMQNGDHVALDWRAREQLERIICQVIFGQYEADITKFERRLNALIMTAEISAYPEDIKKDVERIRKRIWAHLQKTRVEYYE